MGRPPKPGTIRPQARRGKKSVVAYLPVPKWKELHIIAVLNEMMGLGEDDEYAVRWLDVYKRKVEEKESLREQAMNNTFDQFIDAGDVEHVCKDALLETQEERVSKNDEESRVVQQITERFFADRDALDKLVNATSKYAYDLFKRPGPAA